MMRKPNVPWLLFRLTAVACLLAAASPSNATTNAQKCKNFAQGYFINDYSPTFYRAYGVGRGSALKDIANACLDALPKDPTDKVLLFGTAMSVAARSSYYNNASKLAIDYLRRSADSGYEPALYELFLRSYYALLRTKIELWDQVDPLVERLKNTTSIRIRNRLLAYLLSNRKRPALVKQLALENVKLGSPMAMYCLGLMHINEFGVEKNLKKALALLKRSALLGNKQAANTYGIIKIDTGSTFKEKLEGFQFFARKYGPIGRYQPGIKKKLLRFIDELSNSTEMWHRELALEFLYRKHIRPELAKAIANKLAAQGSAKAMYFLGKMYLEFRFGNIDDKAFDINRAKQQGFQYLRHSANLGYTEAQFELGRLSSFSNDPPDRQIDRTRFLALAANKGHIYSQLYLNNTIKWLTRAARPRGTGDDLKNKLARANSAKLLMLTACTLTDRAKSRIPLAYRLPKCGIAKDTKE